MRTTLAPLLLAACAPGGLSVPEVDDPTVAPTGTSTGWFTEPWEDPGGPPAEEPPDWSDWEGVFARIVHPATGEVILTGQPYTYEVELRHPDGRLMTPSAVEWYASGDLDFWSDQRTFESDALAMGNHTLTSILTLPSGEKVAHSIAGVRVQSRQAGTYAGLFSVDGTVNAITITCTGAALISVGAVGDLGEGDGDCLVSLLGIDVPMSWVFDLEIAPNGVVTGSGGVDLLGIFSYDIPAEGMVDPEGAGFDVSFDGNIPFIGTLSAFLEAERVSLDP